MSSAQRGSDLGCGALHRSHPVGRPHRHRHGDAGRVDGGEGVRRRHTGAPGAAHRRHGAGVRRCRCSRRGLRRVHFGHHRHAEGRARHARRNRPDARRSDRGVRPSSGRALSVAVLAAVRCVDLRRGNGASVGSDARLSRDGLVAALTARSHGRAGHHARRSAAVAPCAPRRRVPSSVAAYDRDRRRAVCRPRRRAGRSPRSSGQRLRTYGGDRLHEPLLVPSRRAARRASGTSLAARSLSRGERGAAHRRDVSRARLRRRRRAHPHAIRGTRRPTLLPDRGPRSRTARRRSLELAWSARQAR